MMKSAFESKYISETKTVKDTVKRKKVQQTKDEPSVKKIKTEEPQQTIELTSKKKNNKGHEDIHEEISKKKQMKQKKEKELKKIEEENDVTETRIIVGSSSHGNKREKSRIPECGFFWDEKPDLNLFKNEESSSDSEVETEQQPKQKKKKLSAAERREQEKQKEREIRQREEALASNMLPNSVDQFDRLVLASPDSSIIWLQYMAYHLQTTEIEKARAVARRAVKTINFREENERLNVWNAWLNLESKFGTPESLNDVFQEAVRTNDSLKIYTHMLTVHFESERQNELEKVINTMLGKFKQNPDVWINCGTVLLKMGLKDKSRHIMQRALQSLPPSQREYIFNKAIIKIQLQF